MKPFAHENTRNLRCPECNHLKLDYLFLSKFENSINIRFSCPNCKIQPTLHIEHKKNEENLIIGWTNFIKEYD